MTDPTYFPNYPPEVEPCEPPQVILIAFVSYGTPWEWDGQPFFTKHYRFVWSRQPNYVIAAPISPPIERIF